MNMKLPEYGNNKQIRIAYKKQEKVLVDAYEKLDEARAGLKAIQLMCKHKFDEEFCKVCGARCE